jgi:type IV pilus assembly protein PilC
MKNSDDEINNSQQKQEKNSVSKIITFLQQPIHMPFRKKKAQESHSGKINSEKASVKWTEIEFGRPVPESVLLQVTRQLAAFSAAGIPILDSIELLVRSVKHKRMSSTLADIGTQIRGGSSLSQAVAIHSKIFPKYYSAILEASEQSGDLAATFETLTDYIDREFTSKRTVKSAMYYPAILVVISILAIFILSIVVLPKFEVFFGSLNAKLPLPTQLLLDSSRFVATYWTLFALALIIAVTSLYFYRRTPRGQFQFDQLVLKLPVIGKIIQLILLERFTRILGSLSSAGVPLPQGLSLAGKSLGNQVYVQAIENIGAGVLQGRGFVDPLEETKIFPEEISLILKVGEQSGRLVQQLEFASQYYSKEVDYKLKNASTLIEPLILVFVGGGVGFVAVALVSAMYGIYSSTSLGG